MEAAKQTSITNSGANPETHSSDAGGLTATGARWRRTGLTVVMLAIAAAVMEAGAFVASGFLARMGLMYDPIPVTNYASYQSKRDPVLGWLGSERLATDPELDPSGARITEAWPWTESSDGANCVAAFGDSYTWGGETVPAKAYPNVLAGILECRVANFGVEGYGTDQALLRFEKIEPAGRVVVLGHYTENIIRNVNQARDFLSHTVYGLKPRFTLTDGVLTLTPLPDLNESDYRELQHDPRSVLANDYFVPGGPSGVVAREFPWTLSVLRNLRHFKIRSLISGRPVHGEFYDPAHESEGLQVTAAIMQRFADVARTRDQAPLVVIIPDRSDIEWYRQNGSVIHASLATELERRGIAFVSATERLSDYLGDRDPATLYTRDGDGHLTPEGYSALARALAPVVKNLLNNTR